MTLYSETNPLLFEELDVSSFDLEFEIDTYSPYVYAEYEDNLTEKDVEDIYVLAENEKINRLYVQSFIVSEDQVGEFVSTRYIYVQEGQRIRVAFVSLVNSDMSPDTERVTDYDLYLYNDSGSVKRASTTLLITNLLILLQSIRVIMQ